MGGERNELVICGAGGHSREILQVCRQLGWHVRALVDDTPNRVSTVAGVPVLPSLASIPFEWREYVSVFPNGVGDSKVRRRFHDEALALSWTIAPAIVAPDVDIDPSTRVGLGAFVAPGAQLSVDVTIGQGASIGRLAVISHDCVVESFSTLAPNVALGGWVRIGAQAFVGIGASVRDHTAIGDGAVVGGGAFVASDVEAGAMVYGVPARPAPR